MAALGAGSVSTTTMSQSTLVPIASPRARVQAVPFLDVRRENDPLAATFENAIAEVVRSGRFVLGPACDQFERAFESFCGVPGAIGCASGSDALLLALMAHEVGTGDEVIVPSFTFFATASAVTRLGARPVFVDIDPRTYTLDVNVLASALTPRTRAIIPVHLYGQSADLDPMLSLARQHGLIVVEDCAQATGALYRGQPVGSWGDTGCFSFYPTKNLAGFGDGGLITTSNGELATRLRRLRGHGMEPRYVHHEIGINSRLDTLQAAVLLAKLPHVPGWNAKRAERARAYDDLFHGCGLTEQVQLPQVADYGVHVWNQYTIRVHEDRRDPLRQHLAACGVGTETYYPIPLHLQKCYASLGYRPGSLPESESAAAR